MATIRELPVPGPDPSKTYTVHTSPPIPEELISQPGDIVTVAVKLVPATTSQIISFILSDKQALPWLDFLATNLSVTAGATLRESGNTVASLTLNSLTRPIPADSQLLSEQAEALRKKGNTIFKEADQEIRAYKSAMLHYALAADCCRHGTQDLAFLAKMYSNMSLSSLKAFENAAALAHADISDSLVKDNPKVLYRRAWAYVELDHPSRALAELNHAAVICPNDPMIERERGRLSKELPELLAKRRQHFAEMYNVMLRSAIFKQPLLEA